MKARKLSNGKARKGAVGSAKKRIEREVKGNRIEEYKEQKIDKVNFVGSVHNRKRILSMQDVDFGYGQSNDSPPSTRRARGDLLKSANFEMYGNENVWFYGANGIGKTTVIKLIIGKLVPSSGEVKIGESLKWKYFSQDQSHLPADVSVHDYFINETGLSFGKSFGRGFRLY